MTSDRVSDERVAEIRQEFYEGGYEARGFHDDVIRDLLAALDQRDADRVEAERYKALEKACAERRFETLDTPHDCICVHFGEREESFPFDRLADAAKKLIEEQAKP